MAFNPLPIASHQGSHHLPLMPVYGHSGKQFAGACFCSPIACNAAVLWRLPLDIGVVMETLLVV